MSAYDPVLHELHRKLEAIETRLANHQKSARPDLLWLSAIGFMALTLLGYIGTRL